MRRLLPEPFWPTLAALLTLSAAATLIPLGIVALAGPNVPAWIIVPCYLIAIPCVWWLAWRWDARDRRNTNAPGRP